MVGGIAAMLITGAKLDGKKKELDAAEQTNQELAVRLAAAEKALGSSGRKGLTSEQTPMCDEPQLKKRLNPVLFRAKVFGADEFQVDGKLYTFTDLMAAYYPQRKEATDDGCLYRVELIADPNLRAAEYVTAERRFRDQRLIPVPPKNSH